MIDIKALILSTMLVSMFFCIAFYIYSLEQKTYRGFSLWNLSTLFMALGFLVIILRGTVHDGLSVFAVNGLFTLVAVIRLDAINRFLVDKNINKLLYTIPIFTALAGIIFYVAVDLIEIRTFIVSVALFILSVLISWNLFRYSPPENRLLYYSASIFIAVRGLTVLARAFLWQVDNQYNIFDNSIWSSIQLEFGLISEIGQNVFFLMMNSKRAEANFNEAESKLNSTVTDLEKALSDVKKN